MSADGEISVAVQAEGVDEATGELGGDGAAGGMGVGDGGGGELATPDTGGGGGGKGGSFKKLLTRIATLLVFLGPILDVLGAVSGVLTAFVAPLAVTLMRLLTPVLRVLIRLLPQWLTFMADVNKWVKKLAEGDLFMLIPALITKALWGAIGQIDGWLSSVKDDITESITTMKQDLKSRLDSLLTDITNLPGDIADALRDIGDQAATQIPGVNNTERQASADRASQVSDPSGGGTVVSVEGGLEPFVENVNRDKSIDLS